MINSDRLVIDKYTSGNTDSPPHRHPPPYGASEQLQECCCWDMPSVTAANNFDTDRDHNQPQHQQQNSTFTGFDESNHQRNMMDTLNDMDDGRGQVDQDQSRSYAMDASQIESDEMAQQQQKQLAPVGGNTNNNTSGATDLDDDASEVGETEKGHLAIPEIIETLKNLAACKEKLFKWEQSVSNLESIPDSDPNKSHLMEIIDFVENTKTSTKEKAIYLYEQLGMKCRQHKNYIGAAKAFERAASLRLDISDLNETGDNRESIVTSTIRYLESAIHNYDAIHKFKHAGTLHYRCSKILKMMNASHEEVDRHHEKALEYFTKPDHELKHRKRIDGLKISCYSSYSTLARMHHEIEKFTHTTTTTTTTNTIKFHADGCYRDSEDSDSNHSTTPPPSSSGSAHGSNGPMTPAMQFYGEDRHDYHHGAHNPSDFFDSFMTDNFFDPQSERGPQGGDAHATEKGGSTGPAGIGPNGSLASMTKAAVMEKSSSKSLSGGNRLHHSSHHSSYAHHHESMAAVKDHHHHYHHHVAKSAHHRHHQSTGSSSSSYAAYQKHHKSSSSSTSAAGLPPGCASPLSAALHASQLHKTTFRCIEDRIESARKLVKKLHKLCPFYEVSTNGDDAGRVYCRICDRYLGAVSSTLKNHVNTQEHRQAYEDSQQPPGQPGSQSQTTSGYGASGANSTPALPAPHSLPALPAPPSAAAPPTTSSGSGLSSYQNNSSTATSREDLTVGSANGYSTSANGGANNQKSSYPNSGEQQQQPQPQQLLLQPGLPLSPFMIQANPMQYQPTIQTLDSALQKSHLSGKYMDFDLNSASTGPDASSGAMLNTANWSTGNAANAQSGSGANYGQSANQQSVQTSAAQQYLFNGSAPVNSNGMSLNNLLTFTDAVVNNPTVSLIDATTSSKQAMAAAVLMQSNLGHPHYAIPSTVALASQNSGNGANSANSSNNMTVMAYQ